MHLYLFVSYFEVCVKTNRFFVVSARSIIIHLRLSASNRFVLTHFEGTLGKQKLPVFRVKTQGSQRFHAYRHLLHAKTPSSQGNHKNISPGDEGFKY